MKTKEGACSSVPGSNASDYNSRRYLFHSIQNYKLEIIIVLCLRWLLAAGACCFRAVRARESAFVIILKVYTTIL